MWRLALLRLFVPAFVIDLDAAHQGDALQAEARRIEPRSGLVKLGTLEERFEGRCLTPNSPCGEPRPPVSPGAPPG